jgi:uncharacterized glyoxalase superfamily protein PhnB
MGKETAMGSPIVPTPCYRDVRKAIDFLVDAFGFERHAVYENDDGTIAHAELTLGDAMVMPATDDEGPYGRMLSAVETAGKPTGGFYVIVDDVDAHHDRARAAGAEVVIPPRDRDYGGRDYTCRDLDGHLWTFGSYDPWATTGG